MESTTIFKVHFLTVMSCALESIYSNGLLWNDEYTIDFPNIHIQSVAIIIAPEVLHVNDILQFIRLIACGLLLSWKHDNCCGVCFSTEAPEGSVPSRLPSDN